jgi:Domain of unknown function (DUF1648)
VSLKLRRFLTYFPIAGVAALAVRTAVVWDELPPVMMSHFDVQGNPNGWMPRDVFFVLSFSVIMFVLVLMAVMTERIGSRKPSAGWALLVVGWVTDACLISVFWAAITANLEHAPLRVVPVWVLFFVLIPLVLAVSIDWRWWLSPSRREAARQFASAQLITEQTHGSTTVALIFVLLAAGIGTLPFLLPSNGRPAFVVPLAGAIVVLILASAVWAWRGFVYRFTTAGIEVRALGIRLRSIPISQIGDFRSERCNPLTDFGGWGIKGFGSNTAYIWGGHKVLHIRTHHGDVYLGHNDPERLARDLEAIMKPAH